MDAPLRQGDGLWETLPQIRVRGSGSRILCQPGTVSGTGPAPPHSWGQITPLRVLCRSLVSLFLSWNPSTSGIGVTRRAPSGVLTSRACSWSPGPAGALPLLGCRPPIHVTVVRDAHPTFHPPDLSVALPALLRPFLRVVCTAGGLSGKQQDLPPIPYFTLCNDCLSLRLLPQSHLATTQTPVQLPRYH